MNEGLAIFESVLEKASEELGDITQPVMQMYYERFPQAKVSFEHHGFDNVARLEATMIETVVYTLMTMLERPMEIQVMLGDTVPHHLHVLNIPMNIFYGLIDCTMDVIESVIPNSNKAQLATCRELRASLAKCIDDSTLM